MYRCASIIPASSRASALQRVDFEQHNFNAAQLFCFIFIALISPYESVLVLFEAQRCFFGLVCVGFSPRLINDTHIVLYLL